MKSGPVRVPSVEPAPHTPGAVRAVTENIPAVHAVPRQPAPPIKRAGTEPGAIRSQAIPQVKPDGKGLFDDVPRPAASVKVDAGRTPPLGVPVRPTPPRIAEADLPPVLTERRPVLASPPAVLHENDAGALEAMLDQGKFDEAIAGYRVLAKKHPNDRAFRAGIELCEGLRALAARDRLEAAQRFESALEIDPANERAARELAEMRRQATNERKGLLSRLMGKKES
ncbi:MAG: hypothetical protein KIT31_16485 [Deltaproteobacteria bacterium]|nr:hypothetical protein [Deltaproteobacteria bacterium]